ncbi:MAG: hypothetical protein K0R90_1805 [Oscillospiraceae bacterium]|jgi:uncharacterized phage-like protein YoqJ|nr:hypothetical protein [Oscillospiraceae bacterium]
MEKTVCFSGHRPEKIDKFQHDYGDKVEYVKKQLYESILCAIENGFTCFLTGMARGVDIYAGEIVMLLKQRHPDIKLVCVVPYEGHAQGWSFVWKERHNALIHHCDEVRILSEKFHKGCFNNRNEYMVDHSSLLIAVFNGQKSGTANTINYAKLSNKQVNIIKIPID